MDSPDAESLPKAEPTAESLPETEPPAEKRESLLRFLWDVVETLLLSLLLFWGIETVSARVRVDGSSMEPTLSSGEFVIVSRLAYKLGQPQRGDVIVFRLSGRAEDEYVKRIIGLPGDEVRLSGHEVYVNQQLLDEPYLSEQAFYRPGVWRVPEGHVFVMGDNRNDSSDSRSWGAVPLAAVIGKALVIYWPPLKWGVIQHSLTLTP